MVPIGTTQEQFRGVEIREFVLHSVKRQKTEPCQLAHIQLLFGISEQQSQNLCPGRGKQRVQQSRTHNPF